MPAVAPNAIDQNGPGRDERFLDRFEESVGSRAPRRAMPLVFAWLVLWAARTISSGTPAIEELLQRYDHGDYSAAAEQLEAVEDIRALDRLDGNLKDRGKAWIDAAVPAARRRRTFVVGAVALELTHALVRRDSWRDDRFDDHALHPETLPYVHRLIVAERTAAPDALDHAWILAQIATWEEWNTRARMTGGDEWITPEPVWALMLGQPALFQLSQTQLALGREGLLPQALNRFPQDPRLLLARAEANESIETRCAERYCDDEITQAALDELTRRAKATPPDRPRRLAVEATRNHDLAVANLRAFERLLPVAAEFATLASAYPDVRAEANVHIGYLAIRAARPDAALAPLGIARTSADPYVRYLGEYFTGRAQEGLGRSREAIDAYRRALATVPNAPTAATLLAARLFVSDKAVEREEAHDILTAAGRAGQRVVDPRNLYWYGDARLWSNYMEQLQRELRQ